MSHGDELTDRVVHIVPQSVMTNPKTHDRMFIFYSYKNTGYYKYIMKRVQKVVVDYQKIHDVKMVFVHAVRSGILDLKELMLYLTQGGDTPTKKKNGRKLNMHHIDIKNPILHAECKSFSNQAKVIHPMTTDEARRFIHNGSVCMHKTGGSGLTTREKNVLTHMKEFVKHKDRTRRVDGRRRENEAWPSLSMSEEYALKYFELRILYDAMSILRNTKDMRPWKYMCERAPKGARMVKTEEAYIELVGKVYVNEQERNIMSKVKVLGDEEMKLLNELHGKKLHQMLQYAHHVRRKNGRKYDQLFLAMVNDLVVTTPLALRPADTAPLAKTPERSPPTTPRRTSRR